MDVDVVLVIVPLACLGRTAAVAALTLRTSEVIALAKCISDDDNVNEGLG